MTTSLTIKGKKPFPFMAYKWPFLLVSIFFMVASLYFIGTKGLNFGIDFLGGTKIIYQFKTTQNAEEIRKILEPLNLGDVQVIDFGVATQNQKMVRAKNIEGRNLAEEISGAIFSKFTSDQVSVLSQEVIGPKVGKDLQQKAFMSVLLTCGLILIYIGFRFDFLFAPGAIIALIHDVLISAGFFAFFGFEFNQPILAGLLTILGYSINDTIVIYDRVRENISRLPRSVPTVDIIDISVTETMGRTIVTSLTVFLTVLVMYLFGGSSLHDFAFCLLVGVIFGTYSTVFIASPTYVWLQKMFPNKGLKISEASNKTVA